MAKKAARYMRKEQAEFQKVFAELCYTKSSWQVWADFVEMMATAISNSMDQDGPTHDEREQHYLDTIGKYSREERMLFPRLAGIVTDALTKNPDQDFLGEMFMALEMGSHWKGQFFTPYDICRMMARVQLEGAGAQAKEKGWIGIYDPACGAGALLVAARNELVLEKLPYTSALFVGQDIDRTAALMCYIQISLLGCAGYVVISDTLRYPITGTALRPVKTENNDIWYTPMLYSEAWAGRMLWSRMDMLVQSAAAAAQGKPDDQERPAEEEGRETEKPAPDIDREPAPALRAAEAGQLTLF